MTSTSQIAHQQAVWGPRLPAERVLFIRVPWTLFLLLPFCAAALCGRLPRLRRALGRVDVAALAAWARWMRVPPLVGATFVLAGLASFPLLRTLQLGQYSAITFAAVTAALLALWRGQEIGAGLALLGATLKPHLIVLLPLGLLGERRWRAIGAGAAGLLVLAALSTLVLGPQWPGAYLHLLGLSGFTEGVEQMQNWRGLFESTLGLTGPLLTVLMGLALAATTAFVVWVWWPVWTQKQQAADTCPPPSTRSPRTIYAGRSRSSPRSCSARTTTSTTCCSGPSPPRSSCAASMPRRRAGRSAPRERTVAFILLWLAYAIPAVSFFAQAWRPGLWFALLALALLIARLRRETSRQ